MRRKLYWPEKDPDEVLDYSIDWSERIENRSIASVTWTVPTGLTIILQSAPANNVTTVVLGGGVEGVTYKVGCRITTPDGLVLEESPYLKIKSH